MIAATWTCTSHKDLDSNIMTILCLNNVVSHGAVRSAASSYAATRMVAGSRPVLVIAWEWHIGLALLCGCSGALEYPTTNSCGPINKSIILILNTALFQLLKDPKALDLVQNPNQYSWSSSIKFPGLSSGWRKCSKCVLSRWMSCLCWTLIFLKNLCFNLWFLY